RPRVRAAHAMPLVLAILGAVAFGTPGQPEPRRALAQTPAPPRRASRTMSEASPTPSEPWAVDLARQTAEEAAAKSAGCVQCHQGQHDPHAKPETVRLGCVDCHGGNPATPDKRLAHVWPRFPEGWTSSANPVRSYTLLNRESPEFVRFVNPGDLRVAHISCGTTGCHPNEVLQNRKSMMTHGAMLWGAALYNNGSLPLKPARFGESYSMHGTPQ